jgi:hypothetical protein
MKKQLTYISPLRAGIVLEILYGLLGLILVPFLFLATIFGAKSGGAPAAVGGLVFAILIPVLYAVVGFIGGLISAAIYNLVAKWTGGLEFQVQEVPLAA